MLSSFFLVFRPHSGMVPLALAALLLAGCQDTPSAKTSTAAATDAPPFVAENGRPVGTPGQVPVARQPGLPAPNTSELLPDSLHLVSPGQAGQLRLGLAETELRKLVPASRLREGGRQAGQPIIELLDAAQPTTTPPTRLFMETGPAGSVVLRRILITDPQYRTAEGIGVGSPFGAARQNLGFTKLRDTPFGLAAVSGIVRLGWLLDPASLPAGANQELAPAAVPPAARITGIFIY